MDRAGELGTLLRFAAGTLGSVLSGLVIPETWSFPEEPIFQSLTVGALGAGTLALVAAARPGQALVLGATFGLVHLGYAFTHGWHRAVAEILRGFFLGGGTLIVAVIFDRLAELGFRFGKFLVVGPLMGGIYLAATALAFLGPHTYADGTVLLLKYVFVGFVIGDGLGLGIELVDLIPGLNPRRGPAKML